MLLPADGLKTIEGRCATGKYTRFYFILFLISNMCPDIYNHRPILLFLISFSVKGYTLF